MNEAQLVLDVATSLKALNDKWTPHPAQIPIGMAILNEGYLNVFACCGRNFGKALDLNTEILTQSGWTTIGQIKTNDYVLAIDGTWTKVLMAHEVIHNAPTYEIEFVTGEKIIACEDHQWEVSVKLDRKRNLHKRRVLKTKELNSVMWGKEYNYQIDLCEPVQMEEKKLPINPYILGLWLGDGATHHARISTPDAKILNALSKAGYKTNHYENYDYGILGLLTDLKKNNLIKNKHIPTDYKFGSIEQRLDLIRGLMDTDGWAGSNGVAFYNTNESIVRDVFEIVSSLGEKATFSSKVGKFKGKEHKLCYIVWWKPKNFNPFYLKRKADKVHFTGLRKHRTIKGIKKVPSRPVRCLTVEHPRALFLITRSFIPTHNTELAAYLLWRWAWFNPNSECYLFEPEQKQAKEILWASGRIQNFGPRDWLDGEPNNTEMRLRFKNGSFIKIDGSDNYESYRGVKPRGIIIYDELKDINPKFLDAFEPNRAAHNPPALWIGTPPEVENHYVHYMDEAKNNPSWKFFHAPTSLNPFIKREWLAEKEAYYKRIGDHETWLREYEALFVKGGKSHIFPQWLKLELSVNIWPQEIKHWRGFIIFDPASASTFGVLLILFNPYLKRIKVVDEIYESEPQMMTTKKIWARAKAKISLVQALGVKDLTYVYDEAATWFRNEMNEIEPNIHFEPTRKAKTDKESGVGLIRDVLDVGLLEVGIECKNFKWEMDNYVKDSKGRLVKARDHLIDCFRYFLDAANFDLNITAVPIEIDPDLQKRSYRIEDDFTPSELVGSDFDANYDLDEI